MKYEELSQTNKERSQWQEIWRLRRLLSLAASNKQMFDMEYASYLKKQHSNHKWFKDKQNALRHPYRG